LRFASWKIRGDAMEEKYGQTIQIEQERKGERDGEREREREGEKDK
jgi:hypothetical protein